MKKPFTIVAIALILVISTGFVSPKAHAYGCIGPCYRSDGTVEYVAQAQYPVYQSYGYQQSYPYRTSYDYTGPTGYGNYYPTYQQQYSYNQPYYNQPYYSNNNSVWGSLAYGVTSALMQNSYNNYGGSYYGSSYDYNGYYGY